MIVPRPKRVCRSRRKGTPLPENAVYVGRPTMWGNPFMDRGWGHAKSIKLHRQWLMGGLGALSLERLGFSLGEIESLDRLRLRTFADLHRLEGKDLACWCPLASKWCHADLLLLLAANYGRFREGHYDRSFQPPPLPAWQGGNRTPYAERIAPRAASPRAAGQR